MEMILTPVIVLTVLGLVASALLAASSKLLYVEEDPRVEAVSEALPGANCGGCGYAGCEGYAVAVLYDPEISPDKCCAGGSEVSEKVAQLTGKAMGSSDPQVAFRRCDRNGGHVQQKFNYYGVSTCRAAKLVNDGPYACKYSCFGLGDCMRACPFNGMKIQNGVVYTNPDLCTACGSCVRACPNSVLELIPKRARVMVFCSSQDKGKEVSGVCEVGCISCSKCIKKCPAGAISIKDNRIHIDHQACLDYGDDCAEACVANCPRKIVRCLGTCAPELELKPREEPLSATA
jgi:Na+-translocating ferredoxin:NAD+ oxidoreductase subunit B